MKRPFLTFFLAVVLPSTAAVLAALGASGEAWRGLHAASHARVGRMLLSAFEQDLGRMADSLAAAAEPLAADPANPAVRRVLDGDTVTGLTPSAEGMEVSVLLAPREQDPPGTARFAAAVLQPRVANQVGRATGYSTALYLSGRRWGSTEDAPGPDELDRAVLTELSRHPEGVAVHGGPEAGLLVAMGSEPGVPAPMVALAAPRTDPGRLIGTPLLLVIGLLLLFASLAGWIQFSGRQPERGRARRASASVVLLSMVPALTAVGFIVHADRLLRAAALDVARRDLTRGLAVASALGVTASVESVRSLTTFQATRVRAGATEESTFGGPVVAIARLPSPPGSFTSSGTVITPDGPSVYVARRVEPGVGLVVTAPGPEGGLEPFRRKAGVILGVLAAWLLVLGGALVRGSASSVAPSRLPPASR